MAKEAFNRKRSIFCRPLEKELRKRLVKCFVLSEALYGAEIWTRRKEQKRLEAFEVWIWRRMERAKWTDKVKNVVMLERVGEGTITQELIKKGKKLSEPLGKKEMPSQGCSRRNGKRKESSRQKKISDDRQHYDKWSV